jgi:hypothetical protein
LVFPEIIDLKIMNNDTRKRYETGQLYKTVAEDHIIIELINKEDHLENGLIIDDFALFYEFYEKELISCEILKELLEMTDDVFQLWMKLR